MSAFGSSSHTGLGNNGFEVSLSYITGVPDPNCLTCSSTLKLAFKSLLKRDASTKEKSIVAMLEYIKEHTEELNDDLVIITWVQFYPKLAIDDSKKVRSYTHQIQSLFVKALGKSYAKYLKDTIGVWLAGLFDNDRSVSKACRESLNIAFNNNQEKITNIWKIFVQQILQYSYQVLAYETKETISDERFTTNDESETKFIRVVQAANMLLVQAIGVLNSISLDDNLTHLVQNIYEQELLHNCFISTDFNLKKSAYMSFKALVTSKHVDVLITKSIYKNLAKAMVKGIKFDSKINPLLYATCLITILDALVCVTVFDASFWSNIKKADDKLISLIKLGSLNSEPLYYDVIFKLLSILPDNVFSFTDITKFQLFFSIIVQNVISEKAFPFMEKGWRLVIKMLGEFQINSTLTNEIIDTFTLAVINLLDSPRRLSPAIISIFNNIQVIFNDDKETLLDINSAIMDALPDKDIVFPDFRNYKVVNTAIFVESFINILLANKSDLSEVLLANTVESLTEEETVLPKLAFTIMDIFIKLDKPEFEASIDDFIFSLPHCMNKDFVDVPLRTLKLYTHSKGCNEKKTSLLVNEIYKKLDELNQVEDLLKVVTDFKKFNIHDAKDLSEHLVKNSRSLSPDATLDSDSLYAFLTPTILLNLFENEDFEKFSFNCSKNYKNDVFLEFSIQKPQFFKELVSYILHNKQADNYASALNLYRKLEMNLDKSDEFKQVYSDTIFDAVSEFDGDSSTFSELISPLGVDVLKRKDLSPDLKNIAQKYPSKLLSLGNSLNTGVFLFIDDYEMQENIDFLMSKKLLNKASFLSTLLQVEFNEPPKGIVPLLLFAEYASDVLFFESSFSKALQDKYINFQGQVSEYLSNNMQVVSYTNILENLSKKASSEIDLNDILHYLFGENKLFSYYAHRIIEKLLVEKVEYLTLKEFEETDLKLFLSQPSILFIIINSAKKFLTSKHMELIRTHVLSNILSIRKSSDIMKDGLHNLILLNCFMAIDTDYDVPNNVTLFAPQRLMMLLNVLPNWLESEVAFDENFKFNRIAMSQFVYNYITSIYNVCDSGYPSDFIEKIFSLGTRLVTENINLINSEEEPLFELLSESLKLFLLLNHYSEVIVDWNDSLKGTETEILEIFLKMSSIDYLNRPVQILCNQFNYIFNVTYNSAIFSPFYERLYSVLNTKNIEVLRIVVDLLHKMIPEVQDNLVVEFTLSKKRINEEGESGIKLPEALIEVIREPLGDYIEYEPEWRVYQYLWSWYLVMDHFKNITQQMRQDYISDLGDSRISEFLSFTFSEIDMAKFKLHEDEINYVKNYKFTDHDIIPYEEEVEKVLVNLIYEIMNNIGGTFAQQWFHSIKNKQVQNNIEKFVSKFISPPLINDILSTLSNKNSLEDNDFKININKKINEIKCRYDIDEQKMEISILLPPNYPLSQIIVSGVSRVGVDEKKWKSWLMSAQYVINFQNGSILDSIKHFKDNVTANFENYEDCAICYSILNAVDHSTPNKVCPTCKHNFHSACLYRWFKSSGASTCPLCRSKFNFKKHS